MCVPWVALMALYSAMTEFPDPWLLYLLVDPTSHRHGQVFHVGVAPSRQVRAGVKGLTAADLARPETLPANETDAIEYLKNLTDRGVEPVVGYRPSAGLDR